MITLSLCMIVKNEADVLARCLSSVQGIADEIIIVDTGSTDNTKAIAHTFTPNVYDFAWCDDFSAARNFSFSKATQAYTMWLDADDIITAHDREKLLGLKASLSPAVDMVFLKYDVAFDLQGTPTMSYYRERIIRTGLPCRWVGEIHEVIPQQGLVEHYDIAIQHHKLHPTEPGRNLRIFEKMRIDGKILDPRQQYYYGRELMYNGKHAQAATQLLQFISGRQGWMENSISACKDLAQCRYAMGDFPGALLALLHSLTFDEPRAELCCDIGKHFLDQLRYDTAIFWYSLATQRPMKQENGGFCLPDCYGYIPHMQLCVCYDRLGQRQKAIDHNEMAGAIKPYDHNYLYNKHYFELENHIGS